MESEELWLGPPKNKVSFRGVEFQRRLANDDCVSGYSTACITSYRRSVDIGYV